MVPKQAQLVLANLNWGSAELRNQHLVAGLYADGYPLSLPVVCAGAHCDDFRFVEFLDGCLGEEDACCGFGFGLEALHEDAVEERGDAADGFDCGLWCVSGVLWGAWRSVEGC
jgi:hypothetical protein